MLPRWGLALFPVPFYSVSPLRSWASSVTQCGNEELTGPCRWDPDTSLWETTAEGASGNEGSSHFGSQVDPFCTSRMLTVVIDGSCLIFRLGRESGQSQTENVAPDCCRQHSGGLRTLGRGSSSQGSGLCLAFHVGGRLPWEGKVRPLSCVP